MVRVELGHHGRGRWCSYKRTTLVLCSINIVIALYVLHSLYESLYLYSPSDSRYDAKYTQDQMRKIEESVRLRRAAEPKRLIKLMNKIKDEIHREDLVGKLPLHLKRKIADEILQKLNSMDANANSSMQKDMVENWRKGKLEEIRQFSHGKSQNSTIQPKEAFIDVINVALGSNMSLVMLVRALESSWAMLLQDIGLWIPNEVINKEPDEKSGGEEDFDIIPGRPLPPECKTELHTDYGGDAVRWGLTNPKDSAADCCEACLDQAKSAKPDQKKCNIWVYCPSVTGCYSPDIYEHKFQECWLKYAEKPTASFRDRYSESYRNEHPSAPTIVPWVAGVISSTR